MMKPTELLGVLALVLILCATVTTVIVLWGMLLGGLGEAYLAARLGG